MRNRLLIIGGAAIVVALAAVAGATLLGKSTPKKSPAPKGPETRHYLIQFDQAVANFGGAANSATSGVIRLSTGKDGAVESISLGLDPIDTPKGTSGPVSIALGTGDAPVTTTGNTVSATFPIEMVYPLLTDTVAGSTLTDDVVKPKQHNGGTASFQGSVTGDQWSGTITFTPAAVEGTDFTFPTGKLDFTAPAVYETESQFRAANGGTHIYCVTIQFAKDSYTELDVNAALAEMRSIYRPFGAAILTKDDIIAFNNTLAALTPGDKEIRDPLKVPLAKCYTFSLVKTVDAGGGATADPSHRMITIGRNLMTRCPSATLGRLMAHTFGHIALRLENNETGRGEDNLMRDCAPGVALDPEQLPNIWSFVAEIAPELQNASGDTALQNVVHGELQKVLDGILGTTPAPTVAPTPTSSSSTKKKATPKPTPTRSPTPTPRVSPTPSHSPTPAPTAVTGTAT